MTNSAMRDELIFITNIIKSGSAFGKCCSDGSGVFIPPLVFSKYGNGCDIGDCMMARVITNANDVRGDLPMLAVNLTVPIGVFNDEKQPQQINAGYVQDYLKTAIVNILEDRDYVDRMFSAEDILFELEIPETAQDIEDVTEILEKLCRAGECTRISATKSDDVRVWYTVEEFRTE